ncbi:MAG: hypothetical protein A2516_02940 [Alphaproteobacteria bacterium RIFOXYD12_FULL_60_8]|nr:MAG: hypothetical protein A2516_02940 [Alphaproteobacteria bacterium RIFOXYD12_FULL_60_8]
MSDAAPVKTSDPELALKAARDRFVALAFCWADLVLEVGLDRNIIFAAGASNRIIGCDAKKLGGRPLMDFVLGSDRDIIASTLSAAENHGRINNVPVRFLGREGRGFPLLMAGYCLPDMGDHFFLALRVDHDAAKGQPGEEKPRDSESGLHVPESFSDVAAKALSGGDERNLTVLEIPGFGTLRKRLDTDANDHLQRTIGAYLKANSVDGDAAGRITEDRYGLVHKADLDVQALEKTIAAYTQQADPNGEGVEVKSATVEASNVTMSEADLATGVLFMMNNLRRSKGKDFTLDSLTVNLAEMVGEATKSVRDFKAMIEEKTFEMAFHPIVDIESGQAHHYEVLARFGAIGNPGSPFKDITLAEETGMIRDFDMAMTKKAIEWLMVHGDGGNIQIAVNLSGHSVSSPAFVAELHALLDNYTWAVNSLMFEVTESSEIKDLKAVNDVLQSLRRKGYKICLDDFGAGAANFQYLSALEVDVVKLDGPALKLAQAGPRGRAFIRALTTLCRELNTKIVAEMVEDEASLDFVRQCGVQLVQGYIYAKPSMNIGDFAAMQVKKKPG